MDPKQLKKLADLFGHDLAGWNIAQFHFLELEGGGLGHFPAIDTNGDIVATLDKCMLEKIWNQLERRSAMVTSRMAVVHLASGVAFSLESSMDGDTEPLRIFSTEDIDILCQEKGSVRWAPGLFQWSHQLVRDPVFA